MGLAGGIKRLLNKRAATAKKRHLKIFFESLEPRILLDAVTAHWVGGSGNWSDPTHWDIGVYPWNNYLAGNTYTAIIDMADSDPVITIDQNIRIDRLITTEDVTISRGCWLALKNGMELNGTLKLENAQLEFEVGAQTLSGTGEVVFEKGSNQIYALGGGGLAAAATLTIGPGITIHGMGNGEIQGTWGNYDSIVNEGNIIADAGNTIIVGGANWRNTGLLKTENGGILVLTGTFTSAGLGSFDATGGTMQVSGILDNTGSTLALSSATGSVQLNGTIKGGTVTCSDNAELIPSGGTLDGVTLSSDLKLNHELHVKNGLELNGRLIMETIDFPGPCLYFDGTQTLSGSGDIFFTAVYPAYLNSIYVGLNSSNPETLTIGPGITIHSDGGGCIEGSIYDNDCIINQGVISADNSGNDIRVRDLQLTNAGLLKAENGGELFLDLEGRTFTQTLTGKFDARGGMVLINAFFDNTGSTLVLNSQTGSVHLGSHGTLKGGIVTCSDGAELILTGATLDGVTLNGDITLSSTVHVKNGLELNGKLTLENTYGTSLSFEGTQALFGKGEILLKGEPQSEYDYHIGISVNGLETLNIGLFIKIHGQGRIQGRIINGGWISADTAGMEIIIDGENWKNTGFIRAMNGGILNLAGTFTTANLGTFDSRGGIINITGTLDNTGSILYLRGTTGSLQLGGTIKSGRIRSFDGTNLIGVGGTLDGVLLDGDVVVPGTGGLYVKNGLTLNRTLTMESTDSVGPYLIFEGTQTLSGTGEILFTTVGSYADNRILARGDNGSNPATLTIGITTGPTITIHADCDGRIGGFYPNDKVIINANIEAFGNASLDLDGSLIRYGLIRTESEACSTISISGDLLGGTGNVDQYALNGITCLDGFGTPDLPQQFEVMGQDLGPDPIGYDRNFAYGTLALDNNTYVKLVDKSNNISGIEDEALYVRFLVVPAGTTLDLNGLHLYVFATNIGGTILGGAVSMVPDTDPPFSNVLPLPETTAQPGFMVQWTGEDGADGSGIAGYDVYVSIDGNAYVLWKNNTAATSAIYSGPGIHTYAFYSVARDLVGNVEAAPATPDAATFVLNNPPAIDWMTGDTFLLEGDQAGYNAHASDMDQNSLTYTWNFGDGSDLISGIDLTSVNHTFLDNGLYKVILIVEDGYEGADLERLWVNVIDMPPLLDISGPEQSEAGESFTLDLASSDPGEDTISQWVIDWGDGNVETVSGNPSSIDHIYAAPLPFKGDLNEDAVVDGLDYTLFRNNWGKMGPSLRGDLNSDHVVDGLDFILFRNNWGKQGWDKYTIVATATDEDGTYQSGPLKVEVVPGAVGMAARMGMNESVAAFSATSDIATLSAESVSSPPEDTNKEERSQSIVDTGVSIGSSVIGLEEKKDVSTNTNSGPLINLSLGSDRLGLFCSSLFGKDVNLSSSQWIRDYVDSAAGQDRNDIAISIQGTKDNFQDYLSAWRKRLYKSH